METEDTLKQSHKGFWEHEILQLIRNITDGDFDFKMVCNEVDKMVDFHGQLFTVRKYDDKELASLREQLKQKEEVIKELIPIAEVGQAYYRQNPGFNWAAEREKSKAIIKQEQIYELVKRKDILFLEVKQVNQDLLKALEMLLDHVTEDTMNTNWSDVIKLTKDAIAKSKNIKS